MDPVIHMRYFALAFGQAFSSVFWSGNIFREWSRTPRRSCRAAQSAKHLHHCAAAIRRRHL